MFNHRSNSRTRECQQDGIQANAVQSILFTLKNLVAEQANKMKFLPQKTGCALVWIKDVCSLHCGVNYASVK